MPKRIYRVDYEEKWTGCGDWISDHLNVAGNSNAFSAVERVEKRALRQSYQAEDTGKTQNCVGFRLTGIKIVAEADI